MKKFTTVDLTVYSEDLNDQIGEIHVNRILSRQDKQKALIELGLKKEDLRVIFNGIYYDPKTPIRVVTPKGKTFTFGTEIECFVNHQSIHDSARELGVQIAYEGYNHTDGKSHYKFVTDASVRSTNAIEDRNAIECVSPILKGTKGLSSLKKACQALNNAGATVNKSCGLHVHVGAAELSGISIVHVFHNYKMLESLIDSFMAPSRRNNGYAKSVCNLSFENCNNIYDIQDIMHHDRYYKINAMAYNRHKTIEFRQHQGTTKFIKISMWVNFCIKLVEWSEKNIFTNIPTTIDEIPFLNAKEKAYFKIRVNEMNNDR